MGRALGEVQCEQGQGERVCGRGTGSRSSEYEHPKERMMRVSGGGGVFCVYCNQSEMNRSLEPEPSTQSDLSARSTPLFVAEAQVVLFLVTGCFYPL